MKLTAARVRELLDYDPETGVLTWRPYNALYGRLKGRPAGHNNRGSWMIIEINYKSYPLHNIAWLHYYGRWPEGRIAHRDRDGTNNRIANLVDITPALLNLCDQELTAERLRELLFYDPATGLFAWRHRRGAAKMKGYWKPNDSGYILIRIDGQTYRAHRLAWLYVHGRWPKDQIDHINGIRADNRIANLREATALQNNGNSRLLRTNSSGFRGVTKQLNDGKWTGRWVAQLSRNNRHAYLGAFPSKKEAFAAYMAAAAEHFGDFCPSPVKAQAKAATTSDLAAADETES